MGKDKHKAQCSCCAHEEKGHDNHECEEEKEEAPSLKRWLISFALFLIIALVSHFCNLEAVLQNSLGTWGKAIYIVLWAAVYLFISYDILWGAIKGIIHGKPFDELLLMSIASLGAFGVGEYPEAIAVILFYNLGEYFCSLGEAKSRKNLDALLSLQPENANLLKNDSDKPEVVAASSLNIGDVILVMAGERVPADCEVIEGSTFLDTSSLTGESKPQKADLGDKILSGSMNISGTIKARVALKSEESTASRIMALVEDAQKTGSEREKFISRFARIYTPVVVIGALLLFVIAGAITKGWGMWFTRALNFLVISCPCALVISVPLSYFMGMGSASKKGVLIKGAIHIEDLAEVKTVCFDKTGTLTKETLNVIRFIPSEKEHELLRIALKGEAHSKHPIALSIQRAATERGIENMSSYKKIEERAGKGLVAYDDNGDEILLGNSKLLQEFGINETETDEINTVVNVARNGVLLGKIVIGDEIKEESKDVINTLNSMKINTIMLTGDKEKAAYAVAKELGLSTYKASLLPLDKVKEVESLKGKNGKVAFVGDGINDAAVLLKADVGISMGGISSDAAVESSSVVLVNPSLRSIIIALKEAKKTMRIVKENIAFSLLAKIAILILSIFGIGGMWLAILGDVGLAILAICNSLRA